jgi:lysyl-tRNA synthetase class 1
MPKKKYIPIDNSNQDIFLDIVSFLKKIDADSSSEDIQTQIYEIGKKYNFTNLRDYFKLIYQVLFGQEQGPRLGSFIKLFGIEKTISLIEDLLKQK